MITPEQLENQLATPDGFKNIVGGLFGGGRKKAHAVWSGAVTKRVATNHVLGEYQHEGNTYRILAFSLHGALPADVALRLEQFAGSTALETVRYESAMLSKARRFVNLDLSASEDDNTIARQSDSEAGLFVFPRMIGKGEEITYTIYAHSDGRHQIIAVDPREI